MQPHPFRFAPWLWLATAGAATACFFVLAAPAHAQGADEAPRQRSESPYFAVKSADPALDPLPLKSTDVMVNVTGPIADVTVTQVYRNEGQRAIEARYVFPGSTRAAVHAMNVRLGDRLITAKIREKQQARIDYEAAKKEGKTAALLEQQRPNVFQMNVANILPGDEVRVELHYTELIVPQAGRYEFVFPTVVGPRYASPARDDTAPQSGARWAAQPTLPPGEKSNASFDLHAFFSSPIGLQALASPTHAIKVRYEGEPANAEAGTPAKTGRASVSLADDGDPQGEPRNDRDFILDWRLSGERVQSGVMLWKDPTEGGENFFLAMVEPPARVAAAEISPRDYLFVVDISGSMHGFPLDTAKAMLAELIGGLKSSDSFNVLLFSGSNRMLSPHSVPATRANIDAALRTIDNFQGSGGTELVPALRRAFAEPKAEGVARTVVVVTDGYVTVESEAFALVRKNLSRANVFAFGIGSSVNRHLMEGLARAGMGEPFIITDASQAKAEATRFRHMIETPVLTNLTARFEGLDVYDVEPQALPDLLAERPVVLFGKWRGKPEGRLVLEGRTADGPWKSEMPIAAGLATGTDGRALRHLWARHRIAALSDQEALDGGRDAREAITALGLKYSLLTQYTSFIAIDEIVRAAASAPATTVDQPQPLPKGVGALAVGGSPQVTGAEVPGTPEPAAWGAIAVTLSMLAMLARRARRERRHALTR